MKDDFVHQVRQLYEANRQALYTYALALTRSREAAEDAIHTAFCNLLSRGKRPAELRPYVFRCVRNAAMDYRREHSTCQTDLFEWPGAKPAPLDKDLQEKLEGALAELSTDERECIVLKIFDDMTFEEIAAVRGVSINTAASWYRRGLEKMRTMLEDETL